MIVCKYCLEGIESHEGSQWKRKLLPLDEGEAIKNGYGDDSGEYVHCEWCDEYMLIDEMYRIK